MFIIGLKYEIKFVVFKCFMVEVLLNLGIFVFIFGVFLMVFVFLL